MEIGVVIHGPDVIDSGMTEVILEKLNECGNISAVMAGTIGKTAVLDAHLEDVIDIRKNLKPSRCIKGFLEKKDLVILLNHGKTTNNGLIFANIVMSKVGNPNTKPLIQIERPGMPDGIVVPWNTDAIDIAAKLGNILKIKLVEVPELMTPVNVEDHGKRIIRNVLGVHPGEKIMINGIIVGFAESEEIQIISEEGFIKEIKGARVKAHGLEKLHGYNNIIPIDLNNCWIKSGPLRSSKFTVRKKDRIFKYTSSEEDNILACLKEGPMESKIKAVIIDHEAESTFDLIEGAHVAVTIGDDTTDIAGDILYRLKIPIIGITDGDIDGFSHMKHIYPGSTVLRLRPHSDDVLGKMIREELFKGEGVAFFDTINKLKNNIFSLSKKYVIFSTDY